MASPSALVIDCGEEHLAERKYVVGVLFGEFLGLEHEVRPGAGAHPDVVVRSADPSDPRRLLVADVLFSHVRDLLTEEALPISPIVVCGRQQLPAALLLGDLPLLYPRSPAGAACVKADEGRVDLGFDLFGGAFAMLTRLEEAVLAGRDAHGRFPASASLAARSGYSDRPLVDEYTEVLWWALARLWPNLSRTPHVFATRPTHDVDWPFYSRGRVPETLRDAAADVLVRRDRSLPVERMRSLAAILRSGRGADPCNTFDFLMRESEARGLRSAFYFMGGQRSSVYDSGYSLDDDWIRALLHQIDRRGHEIGVHPSYPTFRDAGALRREIDAVGAAIEAADVDQKVTGGRQHFLRFENPSTWRNWDAAGLLYDSTLGYAEICGFRCGTCRAFPAFDLETQKQLTLTERPLIAMETALLTYQRQSLVDAANEFRRLKAICRQFNGTFTFLWHNNRLSTPAEREAYTHVLD